MSQYFITYTTQSTVNDVVYHSELVRCKNPLEWVEQKNSSEKITYSLIFFDEYQLVKHSRMCKALVSYVSQSGIGDMLFRTEKIIRKHPIAWILDKNDLNSGVKYSLINWWKC